MCGATTLASFGIDDIVPTSFVHQSKNSGSKPNRKARTMLPLQNVDKGSSAEMVLKRGGEQQ
jgi:hypothetical protein